MLSLSFFFDILLYSLEKPGSSLELQGVMVQLIDKLLGYE